MQREVLPESNAAVRLTRVIHGFPIAIEAANDVTAAAYADSDEMCHFPHLYELLKTDSGRALTALVHKINLTRHTDTGS